MRLALICVLGGTMLAAQQAATLRDELIRAHVPIADLDKSETDQPLSSWSSSDGGVYLIAFPTLAPDNLLEAPLHVLRYERAAASLQHRTISSEDLQDDECFGGVLSVEQDGEFILLEAHINPSAVCTLVLDKKLAIRKKLYGGKVAELTPGQFIIAEDQIQFAEAHPTRLQFADVLTGDIEEIYPAKGDGLRDAFSRELNDHMPSAAWCREHNRSCDPKLYDETIGEINGDGKGRLAFTVTHDFFGKEGNDGPDPQHVLYVYRFANKKWTYCELALANSHVQDVEFAIRNKFEEVARRCTPNLPVEADMATAMFNPFSNVK